MSFRKPDQFTYAYLETSEILWAAVIKQTEKDQVNRVVDQHKHKHLNL